MMWQLLYSDPRRVARLAELDVEEASPPLPNYYRYGNKKAAGAFTSGAAPFVILMPYFPKNTIGEVFDVFIHELAHATCVPPEGTTYCFQHGPQWCKWQAQLRSLAHTLNLRTYNVKMKCQAECGNCKGPPASCIYYPNIVNDMTSKNACNVPGEFPYDNFYLRRGAL